MGNYLHTLSRAAQDIQQKIIHTLKEEVKNENGKSMVRLTEMGGYCGQGGKIIGSNGLKGK